MSKKPIFVATHPRACSTAFERVFMTRRDCLQCIHEPFGDAFYYGPERLSSRYENDEKARIASGFSESTYKTIIDRFEKESTEGKRLWIKDMAYYLLPSEGKLASIAPSLARRERGVGTSKPSMNVANGVHKTPHSHHDVAEVNNPTVIPEYILKQFHFTFLIRHPRSSIPSFYRCTVPPLDQVTGWYNFMPSEAGYEELRQVFDHLRETGQVGPAIAGDRSRDSNIHGHAANGDATTNGSCEKVDICVIDADDLLDNPHGIIEAYCRNVGLDYDEKMLEWTSQEDHKQAKIAFAKWLGWHNDAMDSSALKPRSHEKKIKSAEDEDNEWAERFGKEGSRIIRATVDANIRDYEYLKQFALKV